MLKITRLQAHNALRVQHIVSLQISYFTHTITSQQGINRAIQSEESQFLKLYFHM